MANSSFPLFVHIDYDNMNYYQEATVSATPQEIYEACEAGRAVFAIVHANDSSILSNEVPFECVICPLVGAGYANNEYTAIFTFYYDYNRLYVRLDGDGLNVVWAIDQKGGK